MQFIGDNLRKFRTEAGLSRKALAQKIIKRNGKQINARTIINWETGGKPDADSLAEMSELFQKDLILFFRPISYQNALEVPKARFGGVRAATALPAAKNGVKIRAPQPQKS